VVYHEWLSAASRTNNSHKAVCHRQAILYSGLHSVRYDTVPSMMKMSMPMHIT